MQVLDLTLPTPQENLACDEALLEQAERDGSPEVLCFWEPREHFVVLGYSNKAASEANLDACRSRGIPVLRRCSGGGTVLQGPGCLNYALVLRIEESGPLRGVTETNCHIMTRHAEALAAVLGAKVEVQGYTDLSIGGRKFAGNSQRRGKHFLLFHGSFLLNLDMALVEELLPMPSRQPSYRNLRSHAEFLTNVHVPPQTIKDALCHAWGAADPFREVPQASFAELAAEKYSKGEWNRKF